MSRRNKDSRDLENEYIWAYSDHRNDMVLAFVMLLICRRQKGAGILSQKGRKINASLPSRDVNWAWNLPQIDQCQEIGFHRMLLKRFPYATHYEVKKHIAYVGSSSPNASWSEMNQRKPWKKKVTRWMHSDDKKRRRSSLWFLAAGDLQRYVRKSQLAKKEKDGKRY